MASSCEKTNDSELSYKVLRLDSAKRLISSWATQSVLTFILHLGITLGVCVAFPYTYASIYIGIKVIWHAFFFFIYLEILFSCLADLGLQQRKSKLGPISLRNLKQVLRRFFCCQLHGKYPYVTGKRSFLLSQQKGSYKVTLAQH